MRTFATALLVTTAALALPAAGRSDGPLKIQGPSSDKPVVGFPAGQGGKYKAGCWAPVYAVLRNDAPDPVPAGCTFVVEAPDAEDAPGQYSTRGLQEVPAGGTLPVWTYARIGSLSGTVVFTLKGPDKKELARAEADISS